MVKPRLTTAQLKEQKKTTGLCNWCGKKLTTLAEMQSHWGCKPAQNLKKSAEEKKKSDEEKRKSDEEKKNSAEQKKKSAEQKKKSAEQKRKSKKK